MVEDHSLFGHVFKTFTVSMPVQCFRKCRSDCQCISFNYLTTVNQENCELNEENKYLQPNALQRKEGSHYYDLVIDYNVVKGSQPTTCHNGCCQSQPCLNGGTCSEICDVRGKRSQCACLPDFTGFRCEKGTSVSCGQSSMYGVPGYSADSPELGFNNFSSPLAVNVGQEFQIWYTEDLYKCHEGDNDGQTCTDMYGLYV